MVGAEGLPYGIPSPTDGLGLPPPYFNSETDFYSLRSIAGFAEIYVDITQNLRFTGGFRWTHDKKFIRDRQVLYNGDPAPFGTPVATGLPAYREATEKWSKPTGRAVLEWTPDVKGTDSTLVYVSYSRGHKGGGINPPIDYSLFTGVQETFAPEYINAFEIGTKNRLADNTVSANLTGFFYDYKGLQVSKIVARTSVNENINAKIWGAEAEFQWAPDQHWLFNLNAAWLDTKIGNSSSIDPRDPSGGRADATIVKDLSNASNCVVNSNGAPLPSQLPDLIAAGAVIPTSNPNRIFSVCDVLKSVLPAPYEVTDGNAVSLKGNKLQQAPDFTINVGAQYTNYFPNGMHLSFRVDYYYQTSMWGRIFNGPADKIASYDLLNAQITLSTADDRWYIKGYIENIENNDAVVGMYLTDASSGNFTNVFTTEPRGFGITVGARF